MTTAIQHRAVVVLHLPTHVADLIKVSQAVVQAMTGNPSVPSPNPSLASISTMVANLDAAETATKTRAKGTVAARNAARATLITGMHGLKAYVQQIADAGGELATAIITSAGMGVKKTIVRNKPTFTAKLGPVSGTAHLAAKAVSHRASYEWQWSVDGGKTWMPSPVTLQAKTTILGLPAATTCQFRFRAVTRTGEGEWSQVISLLVK